MKAGLTAGDGGHFAADGGSDVFAQRAEEAIVGELLKGVVAAKLEQGGDAAYEKWVDEAKKATQDRREKARKQGVTAE